MSGVGRGLDFGMGHYIKWHNMDTLFCFILWDNSQSTTEIPGMFAKRQGDVPGT